MGRTSTDEVIAEDWTTLLDLLGQGARNEGAGRYRSPFVFRGLSDADYALEAAITRYVGGTGRWELDTVCSYCLLNSTSVLITELGNLLDFCQYTRAE